MLARNHCVLSRGPLAGGDFVIATSLGVEIVKSGLFVVLRMTVGIDCLFHCSNKYAILKLGQAANTIDLSLGQKVTNSRHFLRIET